MLEVSNPGNQPVEIYAYLGSAGTPTFVGTASRGTTSIPLAGTPADRKTTYFVARLSQNTQTLPQVLFRRYCGPG